MVAQNFQTVNPIVREIEELRQELMEVLSDPLFRWTPLKEFYFQECGRLGRVLSQIERAGVPQDLEDQFNDYCIWAHEMEQALE